MSFAMKPPKMMEQHFALCQYPEANAARGLEVYL